MTMQPSPPFERGVSYSRRDDIHARFGGQQQGGISTPRGQPFIFLFTGGQGEAYGYQDNWDPSGVFLYTGEGQEGDMAFVAGNRAIRDHVVDGKDLLLFETLGKSKPVRFLGTFSCANYEIRDGRDRHGTLRRAIVFHLLPTSDGPNPSEPAEPAQAAEQNVSAQPLAQLRKQAYEAAKTDGGGAGVEARRTYRERSEAVRRYVLARANGICEACQEQAPFLRPDGTPYLEPHHIRRLSDGGPDHPAHVGAICPNCHREIHAGQDGPSRNDKLREHVLQLEASFQ